MRTALLTALLAATLPAQDPVLLGRVPMSGIIDIEPGRYVSADVDDLLAVRDLGQSRLSTRPGSSPAEAGFVSLSLLRLFEDRLEPVWSSPPLLARALPGAGLAAGAWTSADVDADGLLELLLFAGDSCTVMHFDTTLTEVVQVPGAWVTGAVACDVDADSAPEIVTLELSPTDTALGSRLLRVYEATVSGLLPASGYVAGLRWTGGLAAELTGTARLEDYEGELPVLVAVHDTPRPSLYGVLFRPGPDSFAFTDRPFPWQEWFSKDRVLPAGKLKLFNVGDTLVGYGYFVPGSRPGGPAESFAALADGEWRLLPLREDAARISSPLCRFTRANVAGWLELRDDIFRFHPGDVFDWR